METVYKIIELAYHHWIITSLFLIILNCNSLLKNCVSIKINKSEVQ